jgi:tetratricopeptide (TPR) repeat protein
VSEQTPILIKTEAIRRSADPGDRSCPVCATPDAARGRRCSSCGVRFVCPKCKNKFDYEQTRTEQPCPHCSEPHPVPADRLVTRSAPSVRPLAAALETWLTANAPALPSIRRGAFDLAGAQARAGNWPEAAALLDLAASEAGDDPPAADLTLWRASAALAGGNVVAAARTLLIAAVTQPWDEPAEHRVRAILEVLTAEDATDLAGWFGVYRSEGEAAAARRHVLSAALWLIAGDSAKVAEELAVGADEDQDTTAACWHAVAAATPIAALLSGAGPVDSGPRSAAALTLAARVAFALGNLAEADELVATVLEQGLTGEGYPEAEAYLLRGRRRDRLPVERAADLLEAAQRMSWREDRADHVRSAEVAEEATELDPLLADAYWLRADSLRMIAYQPGERPDQDVLATALECVDAGRALGPPSSAWPYHVEALLCLELGAQASPAAASRSYRALLAASNFALASPDSPDAWFLVGYTASRLCMWPTAIYASERALQVSADSNAQLRPANFTTAMNTYFQIDPDRVAEIMPELEQGQDAEMVSYLHAIQALRAGDFDGARPLLAAARAKDPGDPVLRYWLARTLVFAGDADAAEFLADCLAAADEATGTVSAALVRAWLLLWQGNPQAAMAVIEDVRDRAGDTLFDPSCSIGLLPMEAAIASGDYAAASRMAAELLPAVPYGALIDLEAELGWLARRVTGAGDAAGTECVAAIQDEVSRAKAAAPGRGPQSAAAVLAELEAVICAPSVPPGGRAAASAAHTLIFSQAYSAASDPATWLLPMALELGPQLIPADAAQTWQQWIMFTHLIPGVRERLRASTGMDAPGIRVRPGTGLAARQFRLLVDEHPVRTDVAGTDGQEDQEQAWHEVAEAVYTTLSARPTALGTPEVLLAQLAEWQAGSAEQQALATALVADRAACIELWARLTALAAATGRIPRPGSGLEALAGDVVAQPQQQVAGDSVGADR